MPVFIDLMNINELLSIHPFHWDAIATAIFCATIIGLERQLRGKPVGIRTSALITLGTYAFIAAANVVANEHTDSARVIGQVVTGLKEFNPFLKKSRP